MLILMFVPFSLCFVPFSLCFVLFSMCFVPFSLCFVLFSLCFVPFSMCFVLFSLCFVPFYIEFITYSQMPPASVCHIILPPLTPTVAIWQFSMLALLLQVPGTSHTEYTVWW